MQLSQITSVTIPILTFSMGIGFTFVKGLITSHKVRRKEKQQQEIDRIKKMQEEQQEKLNLIKSVDGLKSDFIEFKKDTSSKIDKIQEDQIKENNDNARIEGKIDMLLKIRIGDSCINDHE